MNVNFDSDCDIMVTDHGREFITKPVQICK